MGTQKEIAEKIIDKEANYILQEKGNQETLLDDISQYFKEEIFAHPKKNWKKKAGIGKKRVLATGKGKYGNIMWKMTWNGSGRTTLAEKA